MKHLSLWMLLNLMIVTVTAAPTEYDVKAAFLYNFAKFTQWPASGIKSETLNICVLGNGPYKRALKTLEGKNVRGRVLSVRSLQSPPLPDDCHILFVTPTKSVMLDEISEILSEKPGVLSISDIKGFSESGGIIELRVIDNKLRFIINLRKARQSNLSLSSKLLHLAIVIDP